MKSKIKEVLKEISLPLIFTTYFYIKGVTVIGGTATVVAGGFTSAMIGLVVAFAINGMIEAVSNIAKAVNS